MSLRSALWVGVKLAAIAGVLALGSCAGVATILKQAPLDADARDWANRAAPLPRAIALELFERQVYGPLAKPEDATMVSFEDLGPVLEGRARLRQARIRIRLAAIEREVDIVLVTPEGADGYPVILSQNFCPNDDVVPLAGVRASSASGFDCSGGGVMGSVMTYFFGRHIVTPPLGDIIDRGYGYAAVYPSQVVPDASGAGMRVLRRAYPDDPDRPGALAVWASLFAQTARLVEAEIGPDHAMIASGHSRFGKTALMAGAWFEEIDGVIAHQSGTLGASSLTDANGEPLAGMVANYPHWVGAAIAPYADRPESLYVRPADLIAALGDKPLLLGNARRDVWSDPYGAYTEAKAAAPDAFAATGPSDFRPGDRIAYWLRPGTHGVVKEDWSAFLNFLDAQSWNQD